MNTPKGYIGATILLVVSAIILFSGGGYMIYKWVEAGKPVQTTNSEPTQVPTELRYLQYRTFKCEGVFDLQDPTDCFISKYEVSPWKDINIHGGYSSTGPQREYTSLGIAITKCNGCAEAQFIDFIAASRSSTGCSIDVKVDPNGFGVFNETIFPTSDPYAGYNLQAREHIKIPIWQYTAEGITEFMIFPNPAGCDMEIQDFQIY